MSTGICDLQAASACHARSVTKSPGGMLVYSRCDMLTKRHVSLQVHDMLVNVANSLVAGGETGVFSPMHLLVFCKPEEGEASGSGAKEAASDAAATAKSSAAKK